MNTEKENLERINENNLSIEEESRQIDNPQLPEEFLKCNKCPNCNKIVEPVMSDDQGGYHCPECGYEL